MAGKTIKNSTCRVMFAKMAAIFATTKRTGLFSTLNLAMSMNIDWIAPIFLRRPEFRTALYLVPIIMFGKLLFGVYINISIWFKLKDKTLYGLLFTAIGAMVAIAGNYILLPRIGILGSAISVIISYLAMTITCYLIGRKIFPVPYKFIPMIAYALFFMAIVIASFYIQFNNTILDVTFNLSVPFIVLFLVYWLEKRNISKVVEN